MTETIHIAMAFDDNYARHCGVTIASILQNNAENEICFHLLTMGVPDNNKEKLQSITNKRGARICFYDIDEGLVKDMPNNLLGSKITMATYCRLFIADMLPTDIDKVLYLDCDLVVRHNLRELWDTDISDVGIAGVTDRGVQLFGSWIEYDVARYGYVNAGVLLLNLDYWRKNDILTRFKEYIADNAKKIMLHDQDVLNGVLYANMKILDHKWNIMSAFVSMKHIKTYPEYYITYRYDAYIAHFISNVKPWRTIRAVPYFDEYYKYQRYTPWAGMRPTVKEMRERDKLRHILRAYLGIDKLLYNHKEKRAYKKALKSRMA